MRWEQVWDNEWYLKLNYGSFRIRCYRYRLKKDRHPPQHYECEPYYVGYDVSTGKRITGECLTFDMCDAAIERHLQEENKKEFP